MKNFVVAIALISALFAGCALFDSGVVWRGGPYALLWIDIPDDVFLSYDAGKGSWPVRVEEQVFSVGWDGRYVVAKQHPKGNRSITNYYIINSMNDSPHAALKDVVVGPLTEQEFSQKSLLIKLPSFTKILESLQ